MADNRFKDFPTDYRFPDVGTDARFPEPGTDKQFETLGQDNRFEGNSYTGDEFTVSMAGLVLNPAYGPTPQIDGELTATINTTPGFDAPVNPVITYLTLESGDLSTGAAYTPLAANDAETLRVRVNSDNYDPRTITVGVIRYAYPVNIDPPEIQIRNDLPPDNLLGFGEQIEVSQPSAWAAPGASTIAGYAYDNGNGTYTIIPGTSNPIYSIGAADSGKTIVRYDRRASSGGDETAYSNGITVETFTAAASTEAPTLVFTTLNEGDVVEMRANGVTGNPPPTITLQLLVDGVPQAGKTVTGAAGFVTIPAGTAGQTLTVQKTPTNPVTLEPEVVTSIGYGPVTAPVVPPLSNLSAGPQTEDGLPVNYTLTSETGVRFVFTPTGTLPASGPFTGVATQISGQTVSGAHGYTNATLTPLDDLSTLGNMPEGILPETGSDVHVLVNGGGDGDVYAVAINITLNTLTAPILTPVSGGWDVTSPLLKTPVLTPVEGGWNVGD